MTQHTWRVFHVDGPRPDADVTALLSKSGVWPRIGDNLWLCPGGTTQLTWEDMPMEWSPYVECPDLRILPDA